MSASIGVRGAESARGVRPPPDAGRQPDAYHVSERGAHYRTWARAISRTNDAGDVIVVTNSYVELANGIHYLKKGEWVEAREEFELLPGKAVARQGAHTVALADNLNTAGAVELQTPEGKLLRSHVLGLSYFDDASGKGDAE